MRIGIFGHFGGGNFCADGQTVKIKSLHKGFELYLPSIKVDVVDTYYLRKNPLLFIFQLLKSLCFDKKVVFLPALNGRKVLFGFFYYIKKLFQKDIYHDCIAGSLDNELEEHPKWIKYLNCYNANWMESPEQVEKLRLLGVTNAKYVPNFKHIEPVSLSELSSIQYTEPYRFCVFSRIEEMKGIEDALVAISEANHFFNCKRAVLDVYGPIQPGSEKWFDGVVNKYSDICTYKGIVDPLESVSVLKSYFALLFPTRYYREGMPGTIIDAMYAALPVIARKWIWCDNMIINGYNGFSYDFDRPDLLHTIIYDVLKKPNELLSLRYNCLKESEKYSEEVIMMKLISEMNLQG